jgi:predicted  nucleic acid-binding Zn-ribbon protein
MKKKTREEYSIELSIKNPNLDVVGEYVDAKTKIQHRCKKHNIAWEISPSNALKGQGCNYCRYEKIGDKLSKSHEQYVIEAADKNPHVIVLEKYINATTPILHKCVYCEKEWHICPSDVLAGKGCRECSCERSGLYRRKSHQQYINDLAAVNSDIEPIEEYINTDTAILHRCKVCEHIWSIKPNHTLSGHGCPLCGFKYNADLRRKPHDEYVQELSIVNQDIEVVEEYVNFNTRILHKCKACGHIWPIDPSHTLRGQGCPICNQSHGEREIAQWLDRHLIEHIPQYKFDDCRDKSRLPFDFYLPDRNMCIEYDGLQHFEPIDWFGGEKSFKITQHHDNIKTNYCKDNNIALLRIAYNQNVIEQLNKFLLI